MRLRLFVLRGRSCRQGQETSIAGTSLTVILAYRIKLKSKVYKRHAILRAYLYSEVFTFSFDYIFFLFLIRRNALRAINPTP